MFDLIVAGEALIDYTPAGRSENKMNLYEENPGGACANLACAAAKQGIRTAFIGKVGDDSQGRLLKKSIEACNVDTGGMVFDSSVYTTLSFVSLDESGERDFSFARKPGADTCLEYDEIKSNYRENTKFMHFGALALSEDPTRSTTGKLIKNARKKGIIVTYDANYRSFLWEKTSDYRYWSEKAVALSDILKISEEEGNIICETDDEDKAAEMLMNIGPKIICMTKGGKGCTIYTSDGKKDIAPHGVDKVVDTTGAGDCFFGAFLSRLIKSGLSTSTSLNELEKAATFANAAAALCITRRGGIPALPDEKEVLGFMGKK